MKFSRTRKGGYFIREWYFIRLYTDVFQAFLGCKKSKSCVLSFLFEKTTFMFFSFFDKLKKVEKHESISDAKCFLLSFFQNYGPKAPLEAHSLAHRGVEMKPPRQLPFFVSGVSNVTVFRF